MAVFLSRRQNPFLILNPHSQEGPVTVGALPGGPVSKDLNQIFESNKIGVY